MRSDNYDRAVRTVFRFVTNKKTAFNQFIYNISVMNDLTEHHEFSAVRLCIDRFLCSGYCILYAKAEP